MRGLMAIGLAALPTLAVASVDLDYTCRQSSSSAGGLAPSAHGTGVGAAI
jgi:hypothetical protein